MTKRRSRGEGTIYFWQVKDLWMGKLTLPNGKRREQFNPRFEVELRKAGGAEIADIFRGRPSKRFVFSKDKRHEIQCPYCHKKFKRSDHDTGLNPHKDQYGNNCPGKIGYRVF